jgi:hypothetical protein
LLEHGDPCLEEFEASPGLLLIAADSVKLLVEGVDALGGDAEIRAERFVEHSRVPTGFLIAGADLGPQNLARLGNAGAELSPENLARLGNAGAELSPENLARLGNAGAELGPEDLSRLVTAAADLGPKDLPRLVTAGAELRSQAYQAPVDQLEGVAQLRIHRL